MPGTLYVVSTPIGNLDDITLRALNVLKSVAVIAAEDTRRTGNLLRHFGIPTPTTSLHEHNEQRKLPQLLERLLSGSDVAVVSDAGTPLVADPGQRLVSAAIRAGVRIVPVPGPSAILAALTASGFPADEFVFAGFAPSRSNDRKRWLEALVPERRPIVLFEAPHRIGAALRQIGALFGERPIIIARELTKVHEEVIRTTSTVASTLDIPERGEFCLVIGPMTENAAEREPANPDEVVTFFGRLTENNAVGRRAAVAETARNFGLSTNEVYALLERLKTNPPS